MERIRVLASAMSHMPLWFVLRDSGVAENNGISIDIDVAEWALDGREAVPMESRGTSLLNGTYQFLSGLHHEPYAYRARGDKRFVYLAQTQNNWDDRFIVHPELSDLSEVEGSNVVVSNSAPCVIGNLKHALQIGGVDTDKINFVVQSDRPNKEFSWAIDAVENGDAIAAQVDIPFDAMAQRRGLRTKDLPPVPVIHNSTVCSNREWVNENRDVATDFMRALIASIHFFKTRPEETCEILAATIAPLLSLDEDDDIRYLQNAWAGFLNIKPYPHPLAVWNVYSLDADKDETMSQIDPLAPWDFGILRDVDDSDFIEQLYGYSELRNPAVAALV